MGREVRRVPADWQHPKTRNGSYQPLYDEEYAPAARRWLDQVIAWDNGTHPDVVEDPSVKERHHFFWDWDGGPPNEEYYRKPFTSEPTHLQMYEDTSEGTPISPVMATPEELARWLADTGASSFGDMTATYDQWLSTIKRGLAGTPTFTGLVIEGGVAKSAIEAFADERGEAER